MTAYLKSDSPQVSREHSIVQFKTEKFKIGRSAEADLPLKDVNISRNQCVFVHNDNWTLTDTSSNGVWLNNVRLKKNEPVDLKHGDLVLLSEQEQFQWTFNIGAPDPSEERQEPPKKKPRRGEEKEEERRRKLVAQARLMREKAVLEDAFKKGEKLQAELQEEKAMLVSRLEAAAKSQAAKDREAREALRRETEGKVDREETMKHFEETQRLEREKLEEKNKALLAEMEQRIGREEALRVEERRERDDQLAKLTLDKKRMEENFSKEKEEMEKILKEMKEEHQAKEEEMKRKQEKIEVDKIMMETKKGNADIETAMDRGFHCPTCLDHFIRPVALNCGHTYCWLCLAQWKNSNGRTRGDLGTCPECREQVRSETRVLAIEHMIEELTDKMGPEKKKEREEKLAERKAEEEDFKATATVSALNTARPSAGGAPATATVRQGQPRGGRGGAGGGRAGVSVVSSAWAIRAPIQISQVQISPIQISDDSSETSEDSEDDDDEDHFGFGRCFRCGEPGHWVRNCPY